MYDNLRLKLISIEAYEAYSLSENFNYINNEYTYHSLYHIPLMSVPSRRCRTKSTPRTYKQQEHDFNTKISSINFYIPEHAQVGRRKVNNCITH